MFSFFFFFFTAGFDPIRSSNLLDNSESRNQSEARWGHTCQVPTADLRGHALLCARQRCETCSSGHVRRRLRALRRQPPRRLPHRLRPRNGYSSFLSYLLNFHPFCVMNSLWILIDLFPKFESSKLNQLWLHLFLGLVLCYFFLSSSFLLLWMNWFPGFSDSCWSIYNY